MGGLGGGSKLEGGLRELEAALHEYFGGLNEILAGLNRKPPEKPEALILWEKCQAMGVQLVDGGLIDQPFIWLQEVRVVIEISSLHKALNRKNE